MQSPIIQNHLWCRNYYHLHFTGKVSEAERDPESQSQEVAEEGYEHRQSGSMLLMEKCYIQPL